MLSTTPPPGSEAPMPAPTLSCARIRARCHAAMANCHPCTPRMSSSCHRRSRARIGPVPVPGASVSGPSIGSCCAWGGPWVNQVDPDELHAIRGSTLAAAVGLTLHLRRTCNCANDAPKCARSRVSIWPCSSTRHSQYRSIQGLIDWPRQKFLQKYLNYQYIILCSVPMMAFVLMFF